MLTTTTSKCHKCGYYFDGSSLNSCPRCSQGFSGPIDDHFVAGQSGELGKGIQSKGLRVAALIIAVLAIGAVISANNKSSNNYVDDTYSSSDQSSGTNDGTYVDNSSWLPDGYEVFNANSDIAQESNFQAGRCLNANANSSLGYCWQFKIVSKYDCQAVNATLDLSNDGNSIGQAYGELSGVTAGNPTLLEIDAYDNPDVGEATSGDISEITCSN
jgi:hypothetical protein